MRSEKVFEAASRIPNRYSLCQTTARATRRMHVPSTRPQDTMNEVLSAIGNGVYRSAQDERTPGESSGTHLPDESSVPK